MDYLRRPGRIVMWMGVTLVILFAASVSPASASSYAVPDVFELTATLPGGVLTPETHLLCLVRATETSGDVASRAVCYASIKPDSPPQSPPAVLRPANHNQLSGEFTTGQLTLRVFPCIPAVPGASVSLDLIIPLDKGGGSVSGNYTTYTVDDDPPLNCDDGTQTTGPLTLTPLALDHNEDSAESLAVLGHADPCTDRQELHDAVTSGGMRDPFNPYDFYDPDGNGSITLGEVLTVAGLFGAQAPGPPYEVTYDRGPSVGPNGWNTTAPDGAITLGDINAMAGQFGHSC